MWCSAAEDAAWAGIRHFLFKNGHSCYIPDEYRVTRAVYQSDCDNFARSSTCDTDDVYCDNSCQIHPVIVWGRRPDFRRNNAKLGKAQRMAVSGSKMSAEPE